MHVAQLLLTQSEVIWSVFKIYMLQLSVHLILPDFKPYCFHVNAAVTVLVLAIEEELKFNSIPSSVGESLNSKCIAFTCLIANYHGCL